LAMGMKILELDPLFFYYYYAPFRPIIKVNAALPTSTNTPLCHSLTLHSKVKDLCILAVN
jgi:hypothetical protein